MIYQMKKTIFTSLATLLFIGSGVMGAMLGSEPKSESAMSLPLKLVPTEEQASLFTVADVNNDKVTWRYDVGRQAFHYAGNKDVAADDWLFLPAVKISDTSMYYDFSMDSWVSPYKFSIAIAHDFAKFEVYVGKNNTPEAMTEKIIPLTTVSTDSTNTVHSTTRFTVPVAGDYTVGIKLVSDKNKKYFNVNNFSLSQSEVSVKGPAEVSDLKGVGAPEGALKAIVTFRMPATDTEGNSLKEDVTVKVTSELETKSVTGAPGTPQSVEVRTLQSTSERMSLIKLSPSSGGYVGLPSEINVWTGVEIPGKPENVYLVPNETNMGGNLRWDPITTGKDGGYVDSKEINYYLYQRGSLLWTRVGLMGKNITSYDVNLTAGAKQAVVNVAVGGENIAGYGSNSTGWQEILGTPWSLPAIEKYVSVSGGSYTQIITSYQGTLTRFSYQDPSKLGEKYANAEIPFAYTAVCAGTATAEIKMPKFSTERANSVAFIPNLYVGDCENVKIGIRAYDTEEEEIFDLSKQNGLEEGWQSLTIPLPAKFQNRKWVQLVLHPSFTMEKPNFIMGGYQMRNMVDYDICIAGIEAPLKVTTGTRFDIDVEYVNRGLKPLESYKVELYQEGVLIDSVTGSQLIGDSLVTSRFNMLMSPLATDTLRYRAKVTCPGDAEPSNDRSEEILIIPRISPLPAVNNFRGCQMMRTSYSPHDGMAFAQDDELIFLEWDQPDIKAGTPVKVTEDFEDARAFTDDYGGWIFKDVDKSPVGGFNGMTIPCITIGTTTGSFWIWDQSQLGNKTFEAHSGTKYLFSMLRWDNGQSDDWAISPVLYGGAQTISFYAKSYIAATPDNIEVYYSTGSTDPKDFILIKDVGGKVPNAWTLYEAELPAGAVRFAIRKNSSGGAMLMVDDVTMTPAPEIPENLRLIGYDVYRDGVLITEKPLEECRYEEYVHEVNRTYLYQVVAVYDQGMSSPSRTLSIHTLPSALDETLSDSCGAYGGKGLLRLEGFGGKHVTVTAASGHTVFSSCVDDTEDINLLPGIYVVTSEGFMTKVMVR